MKSHNSLMRATIRQLEKECEEHILETYDSLGVSNKVDGNFKKVEEEKDIVIHLDENFTLKSLSLSLYYETLVTVEEILLKHDPNSIYNFLLYDGNSTPKINLFYDGEDDESIRIKAKFSLILIKEQV